jgi:hypothetical protein
VVVGATNHPALIDPAVFRRFQVTVALGFIGSNDVRAALLMHLGPLGVGGPTLKLAVSLLAGSSGSSIRDVALEARRTHLLDSGISADAALLRALVGRASKPDARRRLCVQLRRAVPEPTYAELALLFDVSRATIFNYLKVEGANDKEA